MTDGKDFHIGSGTQLFSVASISGQRGYFYGNASGYPSPPLSFANLKLPPSACASDFQAYTGFPAIGELTNLASLSYSSDTIMIGARGADCYMGLLAFRPGTRYGLIDPMSIDGAGTLTLNWWLGDESVVDFSGAPPLVTPTPTLAGTATPTAEATPSLITTATRSPTPTATATPMPTVKPTPVATPTPTVTPTPTLTPFIVTGDWVIEDQLSVTDKRIEVTGDIRISFSGDLTLSRTTLVISPDHKIVVDGGRLAIEQSEFRLAGVDEGNRESSFRISSDSGNVSLVETHSLFNVSLTARGGVLSIQRSEFYAVNTRISVSGGARGMLEDTLAQFAGASDSGTVLTLNNTHLRWAKLNHPRR